MIYRGQSIEDIHLSLSRDDNTVRRYATGFKQKGLTAYFDDNYVLYCGKLTEQQEKLLVDHLSDHLLTRR